MNLIEHYVTNIVETLYDNGNIHVVYDLNVGGGVTHVSKIYPRAYWFELRKEIDEHGYYMAMA